MRGKQVYFTVKRDRNRDRDGDREGGREGERGGGRERETENTDLNTGSRETGSLCVRRLALQTGSLAKAALSVRDDAHRFYLLWGPGCRL